MCLENEIKRMMNFRNKILIFPEGRTNTGRILQIWPAKIDTSLSETGSKNLISEFITHDQSLYLSLDKF